MSPGANTPVTFAKGGAMGFVGLSGSVVAGARSTEVRPISTVDDAIGECAGGTDEAGESPPHHGIDDVLERSAEGSCSADRLTEQSDGAERQEGLRFGFRYAEDWCHKGSCECGDRERGLGEHEDQRVHAVFDG